MGREVAVVDEKEEADGEQHERIAEIAESEPWKDAIDKDLKNRETERDKGQIVDYLS